MTSKFRTLCLLLLTFSACDQGDAQSIALRSDSHWADVVCSPECYGLVPEAATSDLWAPVTSTTDLRALLDAGLLVSAPGYGGCGGTDGPTEFPWSACFATAGNGPVVVHCYGGDSSWVTLVRHACELEPGFAAANTDFAAGSCTALPELAELPALAWVYASAYQPNVARAGLGTDTFHVHPGCSI